jgi:hypothetical protein
VCFPHFSINSKYMVGVKGNKKNLKGFWAEFSSLSQAVSFLFKFTKKKFVIKAHIFPELVLPREFHT